LISSIKGTLEGVGPAWADISVGGVTLRVNVPASLIERLGQIGGHVRLFTSLQVREDSLTLFGFPTEEARQSFEKLLEVNGVGPKVALGVLSRLTPEALATAVSLGDIDAFSGVPGVGKKTASRIVLELKGKLDETWLAAVAAGGDDEVLQALTALGYTASEARRALSALPNDSSLSLEDKVRLALQQMAAR
jgi:Holliday junction DNA helicase RuvA